ncbi:MAG: glycolate oxidase subunit GlcE [Sulfurifustaceae bacterium]
MDADRSAEIAEVVRAAARENPLQIVGSGSKSFYGRAARGQPLRVADHRGILAHEPTELVLTARAGTPLREIEATLAESNQMLGFEPPYFADTATLGGTIACGFSGPRRPYAGSARDFVLGTRIINGKGEILSFGGQVMKNVAGYDVSRLMVGALGTLGVLLDVSLKVLPRPEHEITLTFTLQTPRAIERMNTWAAAPLPLSAACHWKDTLYLRLAGSEEALRAARTKLGGDEHPNGTTFWRALREHQLDFFADDNSLWRLSVPPASAPLPLAGSWLIDWGGAQRWLKTSARATDVWEAAARAGGHATLFRGGDRAGEVFHPLARPLAQLHSRLKRALDPATVLNPGRYSTAW